MSKYKCINCRKTINPTTTYCPNCNVEQPLDKRLIVVKKQYGADSAEIREIECSKCGCKTAFFMNTVAFDFAVCSNCGDDVYMGEPKVCSHNIHPKPTVTCPYCKSTNTKKISSMSKASSVAMWGIFALGKTTKQWHCNNCKSDF